MFKEALKPAPVGNRLLLQERLRHETWSFYPDYYELRRYWETRGLGTLDTQFAMFDPIPAQESRAALYVLCGIA